ncbi:MAG: class I SAM-dependent methyltransferase [Balneola sp.]|nr:class I SAM-dependent methyltransferase [Balneola sp.]MBO6649815.1 class I SAM-dependent methyltransferase [Balneola sp.]MBO6712378.1 class I SAM-dependent methyltransferase [Balneola sp.]MBO6801471.1 class I SAM-dependent methyltransferase [Balneola sp.]MBO6871715.1 class I SAM-dependent methyltransferase [Balneola sp.]
MEHSIRYITKEEQDRIESLYSEHNKELSAYVERLLWWNSKINLVSRDVSRETLKKHVKHSLYVSLFESYREGSFFVDTGSGGGLPGLPLSLCFKNKRFEVNDIVSKKVFAVNDMILGLNLSDRVKGRQGDIREMGWDEEAIIVTKHAFKVDQLYSMVEEKKWSRLIFLKGHEEAVEEAKNIKGSFKLSIIKLDAKFMDPFFKGKGVVELSRGANE